MNKVITFTVNPALDKSTSVKGMKPHSKLRCAEPVVEPGGGGVNISKVIKELGSDSLCTYLAGGPTGLQLKNLLSSANILQQIVGIEGWTRENIAITDNATGLQYRFGMPGPKVTEQEWRQSLVHLEGILMEGDYLVASGSLPPGVPDDFYRNLAYLAKAKGVRFILDTHGEPLRLGVEAGVFMLKPNLAELSTLCGVERLDFPELEVNARKFMEDAQCEIMVVSLGPQGALLVTAEQSERIIAPTVKTKSTIGAGDSMMAGMVQYLSLGKSYREMARYGVACGTAATMTPGTQLCRKEDVETLYRWINAHPGNKKAIRTDS